MNARPKKTYRASRRRKCRAVAVLNNLDFRNLWQRDFSLSSLPIKVQEHPPVRPNRAKRWGSLKPFNWNDQTITQDEKDDVIRINTGG